MQTLDIRKVAVEVRNRILTWPETYDQNDWLTWPTVPGRYTTAGDLLLQSVESWSECGTTACVAGHISAVVSQEYPELTTELLRPLPKEGELVAQAGIAFAALGYADGSRPWVFNFARTKQEVLEWLDAVAAGEDPVEADRRMCEEYRRRYSERMERESA